MINQIQVMVQFKEELKIKIPEIIESFRYFNTPRIFIRGGENLFYEDHGATADPSIFNMLDIKFIKGDRETALKNLFSIVLTEETGNKYFGEENPMGKTLNIDDEHKLSISGVIENVPVNSHLHFNILINYEMIELFGYDVHWENLSHNAYALLGEYVDLVALKTQIDTLTSQLYSHGTYEFHLQPLSEVHLRSSFDYDVYGLTEPTYQYIRIFILIGVFVLLISVINYINLATATQLPGLVK